MKRTSLLPDNKITKKDINIEIINEIKQEMVDLKIFAEFCANYKQNTRKLKNPNSKNSKQPLTISKFLRFKNSPMIPKLGKKAKMQDYINHFIKTKSHLKLQLNNPREKEVALELVDLTTSEVLAQIAKCGYELIKYVEVLKREDSANNLEKMKIKYITDTPSTMFYSPHESENKNDKVENIINFQIL